MTERRCPGCNHPEPLHTMSCEYRNQLLPILQDLIEELKDTADYVSGDYCAALAGEYEVRLREVLSR